jgi:hypothetical protein
LIDYYIRLLAESLKLFSVLLSIATVGLFITFIVAFYLAVRERRREIQNEE